MDEDGMAAFVTARLGEDEAVAREAGGDQWADRGDVVSAALAEGDYGPDGYWVAAASFACEGEAEALHDGHAAHIARHDPARVLREVAAKRAMVARHKPVRSEGRRMCSTCLGSCTFWPCPDLRALAAIWSDHPDYRGEWKA